MSQCRGVAAFNGRYVEPVRSSVLGQIQLLVKVSFVAPKRLTNATYLAKNRRC